MSLDVFHELFILESTLCPKLVNDAEEAIYMEEESKAKPLSPALGLVFRAKPQPPKPSPPWTAAMRWTKPVLIAVPQVHPPPPTSPGITSNPSTTSLGNG